MSAQPAHRIRSLQSRPCAGSLHTAIPYAHTAIPYANPQRVSIRHNPAHARTHKNIPSHQERTLSMTLKRVPAAWEDWRKSAGNPTFLLSDLHSASKTSFLPSSLSTREREMVRRLYSASSSCMGQDFIRGNTARVAGLKGQLCAEHTQVRRLYSASSTCMRWSRGQGNTVSFRRITGKP